MICDCVVIVSVRGEMSCDLRLYGNSFHKREMLRDLRLCGNSFRKRGNVT